MRASRGRLTRRSLRTRSSSREGPPGTTSSGLDLVYFQAKRWAKTVERPDIHQFVGALNGQRASKGVFITTATFSREAVEYADTVNPRVILVDGKQLAETMLDHDVGVTVARRYDIKRIDLDYFGVEDDGSTLAEPAGAAPTSADAPTFTAG
jgi:hypothetical protein